MKRTVQVVCEKPLVPFSFSRTSLSGRYDPSSSLHAVHLGTQSDWNCLTAFNYYQLK